MNLPFSESRISDNVILREFLEDTSSEELVWHRDKEDRIIESVGIADWMIQIDNNLPTLINSKVFIPKETYHRLIKGSGSLILKIYFNI